MFVIEVERGASIVDWQCDHFDYITILSGNEYFGFQIVLTDGQVMV